MAVLGIPDPWIWLAYILCFASTGLCVVWGIKFWNSEDEDGDDIEEEVESLEEKPLDETFVEEKEE